MRRSGTAFTAILLAALFGSAAAADSPGQKPFDIYARGDYAAAMAAGEKENDGEGLAVAARAALAEANLRDVPCLECLERAETYSLRAIMADPKSPESYVYYAISLGYEGRIIGVLRAKLANYPEKAKHALDTALTVSPGDSWTLAALGGWNVAVVEGAGTLLGHLVYGAKFDQGVDLFRRGIAAEPQNLVLPFQFALSLSGYDFRGNRTEIETQLKSAAGEMPRTAYESVIKMRAVGLLDLLRTGNDTEFRALVRQYQGYP